MKRLAIIGAGELGTQVAILSQTQYEVIGFFDDYAKKGTFVNSWQVIGPISEIEFSFELDLFDCIVVAVGYNHMHFRKSVFEKFANKIPFANVIAHSAIISEYAQLGVGNVIYEGCIIDKGVKIHNNVLLNLGVVISHDSVIGSHSFLAPRATVAGFSNIEELNFIGTSTTVIDNIRVCSNCRIGAGALVLKNIETPGTYVGVPAKILN